MKVRHRGIDTPKPWELDLGLICGKRKREFYATKKEAESAMDEKLDELRRNGENSLALNTKLRLEYAHAEERLKKIGKTITQAVIICETLHDKFQPVALSKAIADCVAAKKASGKRDYYTKSLKRSLELLSRLYPTATTASITQQQIEHWSHTGKVKGGKSKPLSLATTRTRLIDARTLFNFCLKRKWILESPCVGIEPVQLEEKPPGIHTVEQVKTLLGASLKHDKALLGYLCPIYFGGLRPSESAKLAKSEVHADFIEVQGPKGKGRKRRFATINETLKAWLAVKGVEFGMSKRSRRLERLRGLIKKETGKPFPWPHDCLRHSFCSYSLPKYGAAVTAANAGHSEQILFAHYRERVKPDDVAAYWALRP